MFLLAIVEKFTESCPLKYSVVRNANFLIPKIMLMEEKAITKLKNFLTVFVGKKRFSSVSADSFLNGYSALIREGKVKTLLSALSRKI